MAHSFRKLDSRTIYAPPKFNTLKSHFYKYKQIHHLIIFHTHAGPLQRSFRSMQSFFLNIRHSEKIGKPKSISSNAEHAFIRPSHWKIEYKVNFVSQPIVLHNGLRNFGRPHQCIRHFRPLKAPASSPNYSQYTRILHQLICPESFTSTVPSC